MPVASEVYLHGSSLEPVRALATLLADTALAFTAPGEVVMGLILVALAILGFSRVDT